MVTAFAADKDRALTAFTHGDEGFRSVDTYAGCVGPDGIIYSDHAILTPPWICVLILFMLQVAQQRSDQQTQDAQYYRCVLHDLLEIGADMARLVHQQARFQAELAQPVDSPDPEKNSPDKGANLQDNAPQAMTQNTNTPMPAATLHLATAFDRVARTMRRTIMLARNLNEPVRTHAAPEPDHHSAAYKRIRRAMEDDLQRSENMNETEGLDTEYPDRLDGPDLQEDLANLSDAELAALRSIADSVKDRRRDLTIDRFAGPPPFRGAPKLVVATPPDQTPLSRKSTDPP